MNATQSLEPTLDQHQLPDTVEIGTGTWQWGDTMIWGFGKGYGSDDVRAAFHASLDTGISFYDSAEVYGRGKSERLLGQFVRESGAPVLVATKFAPYPWRFSGSQLLAALRGSLRRLEMSRVDLYQIHWPMPPVGVETWANALADALDLGLTRAVGVSNYNREQTIRSHAALAARGYPLAANQVEYSLIDRHIERDGTLQAAQERGVRIIAYSPLGKGLLSGKYSVANPPPGLRGRQARALLPKLPPLIEQLRAIGQAHGKSPAQVALNWTICKGTLPIPGAKNAQQAQANAGAVGWRLSSAEVAALDELSAALG